MSKFNVKCFRVPSGIDPKKEPWLYKYIQLNGYDVMSREYGPDVGDYGTQENVYKKCIEKGVTWRELLDYKEIPENVML